MKKIFTTFMLIAAAALAFSSCNKDELQGQESNDEIVSNTVFHITASPIDTKTVFGDKVGNAYPTKWTKNKKVRFAVVHDTAKAVDVTPSFEGDGSSAIFEPEFDNAPGSGTIYAFSPVGDFTANPKVPGFTSFTKADDANAIYVTIPSAQTPLAGSVDESAQAMAASQTYTDVDDPINMSFHHIVAYGKMAISNFTGTIKSVELQFPVEVAGLSCKYVYGTGVIASGLDSKTITLDATNVTNNTFWFALAPTAGNTGEMKIVVTDDNDDTYVKTINLDTKALPFVTGKVSSFTANFIGITPTPPQPVIADGNYAILAKRSTGNYFFMTSDLGSASTKRYQAVDSGLSTLPESLDVNGEQIWTVTNSADGMIISSNSGQQITWSSGNSGNLGETGKKLSAKEAETTGAYNISIVETSNRILALNLSSPYFAFYEGTQAKDLFFVPATISEQISYNLSVSTTSITGVEAIDATKKITVTTNTSDWTATTENDWISISITNNIVTLTFSDNVADNKSTSERTGKVTISSVMANTSIDVSVTQNGKEYVDPSTGTVYTLVSDLSTLKSGDVIVLGCAAKSKAAGAMGSGAFFTSVDATIKDGKLTSKDAIEITIGGETGEWTLTTSEGTVFAKDAKKLSLVSGTSTWKFDEGKIASTNSNNGWIQYNASSPRFLNYTSSQTAIEVYKK